MSSVNPPEGYNTYYQKHLTELEGELKDEANRAKKRSRDEVEELSKNYQDSLRKVEDKASDSVDRIREDTQRDYERSRDSERAELDRIKRQNYDKFGRDRTNEAESSRQRLEEYVVASEAERKSHEATLHDREQGFEKRVQDLNKDFSDRTDRAIATERDSAASTYQKIAEKDKSALETQREEAAKRYQELTRARMEDQQETRRRSETLINDAKRDMDNAKTHSDIALEQRLAKDHDANFRRIEDNAKLQHDSHEAESRQLRDKLQDLLDGERQYVKERGQGKVDAVREVEDEWRTKSRVSEETHNREMAKIRDQADKADAYNSHINDRNLHDRDSYFTSLLAKKAAEGREEYNSLATRYEKGYKEMETRGRKDRQYSQDQLENAMHSASEERREALENQALTYQHNIETQRELDRDSMKALEKEIEKKNTLSDDMEIPPGVENAVRRSVVRQYEKNLNAETERNRRVVDGLQRSYADRMQTADSEHQTSLTKVEQTNQAERHADQNRFIEHVQDTEYQKNQSLRTAQEDHERQTDNLSRTFSQMSVRQRADYESILQAAKDDAASRINAVRQEAEFASKTQQRAFSTRQNELIREYEKKLADQKTEYDGRLDDVKSQASQTLRETERRSKTTLEDQARGYEQRLAQQEVQHQERERNITQNFQDELDKVKRSNALLQSKKS